MARHHRARAAAAALALSCLMGCSTDNLQFRNDHRLTFHSPEERAKVTAPLTMSASASPLRCPLNELHRMAAAVPANDDTSTAPTVSR